MATVIRTRRQAAVEASWLEGHDGEAGKRNGGSPQCRRRSGDSATAAAATPSREEARQSGPDPNDEGNKAVAILFLAHDGVANPTLWERWRLSDPAYAERIRFFVFRNQKVAHPSPFAAAYDVGLRMRTSWCSASIVKATVESLRRVLLLDAEVGMVYLVSGFDLPIQPPRALFQTRRVVTEGVPRTVVPFTTVLAYTPGEDEALRAADGWGKRVDQDVRARVSCHVQWCGLSRAHAKMVVGFKDLPRLLSLGNKLSDQCCPDEWVLGTILALQGVGKGGPDVIDWPVTDQYRQRGKAQSPILWGDLDRTRARVFWAPPSCYRTFTLARVLDEVSRREGNLFFRKVGPLSEEEEDRVLAPIMLKEQEKEPAEAVASAAGKPAAGQGAVEPTTSLESSGASEDTRVPEWEPEPDVDDEEEEEERSEDGADRKPEADEPTLLSSASSVASARTAMAAADALSTVGGGRRSTGSDDDSNDDEAEDDASLAFPSTPHKHMRVAAEAALSEDDDEDGGEGAGKGAVLAAARSLRMVGPPGRCANGQC